MKLYIEIQKLPRSTTQAEWKKLWRWKRQTERKLAEEVGKRLEFLAVYGTTHPELYKRIADDIVNPPLLWAP